MSHLDAIALAPPSAKPPVPGAAKDERGFFDKLWGEEGFSFGALLDIVNPLQHIPIVGTVYRSITGDTIGAAPRIAGGTLFGGVFGLVASVMDSMVEGETGKDLGEHLLAFARENGEPPQPWLAERDDVLLAGDFSPKPAMDTPGETMMAAAVVQAPQAAAPAATSQAPQAPARATARAPGNQTQVQAAQTPDTTTIAPAEIVPGIATPVYFRAQPHIMAGQGNPREAANGAGGRLVPLTTSARAGRTPINLPSPQAIAADPALLRQMQATQAQGRQVRGDKAQATKQNSEAPAQAVPTFLDYTPRNAALMSADAEVRSAQKRTAGESATSQSAPAAPADGIQSVPPDLITRMNMALERYQTMQRGAPAPSVNVSH